MDASVRVRVTAGLGDDEIIVVDLRVWPVLSIPNAASVGRTTGITRQEIRATPEKGKVTYNTTPGCLIRMINYRGPRIKNLWRIVGFLDALVEALFGLANKLDGASQAQHHHNGSSSSGRMRPWGTLGGTAGHTGTWRAAYTSTFPRGQGRALAPLNRVPIPAPPAAVAGAGGCLHPAALH